MTKLAFSKVLYLVPPRKIMFNPYWCLKLVTKLTFPKVLYLSGDRIDISLGIIFSTGTCRVTKLEIQYLIEDSLLSRARIDFCLRHLYFK